MRRHSIVHLITGLGVGGAERVLVRLASALPRDRFDTLVVSMLEEGPLAVPLREAGIEVRTLAMAPGRPSIRALGQLVRLLRGRRPDVLQTWLYHADLMGLAAAALSGVGTVIWNIRASDLDLSHSRVQSRWTRWACARLSPRPRAVVVNADAGRMWHEALGYRPREWVIIPNGVDVSAFRPDPAAREAVRAELGIPADAPVVGLIARWDPAKGHGAFLAAAARLAAARPDARFVLVGEGVTLANPDLAELAARLAPNVEPIALGRRDDVARLAAAFDVSTCSSISEGFPNAVVESMACGVPCVVTDVGDAADIVGDTGVVVPPRDATALAGAWAALLGAGTPARVALGERARARVVERYTLERMVSAYERLYERVS